MKFLTDSEYNARLKTERILALSQCFRIVASHSYDCCDPKHGDSIKDILEEINILSNDEAKNFDLWVKDNIRNDRKRISKLIAGLKLEYNAQGSPFIRWTELVKLEAEIMHAKP